MGKYWYFAVLLYIFTNITEMQSLLTWSNAFSLSPTSLHEIQLKPAELQSPLSHQCPTICAEKCRITGGAQPLWQLSFPTSSILVLPSEVGILCRIEFLLLRLRILDLSNNYLTELPDEIGNLSEIVQLQLGNNQLSTISPPILQPLRTVVILSPWLPSLRDNWFPKTLPLLLCVCSLPRRAIGGRVGEQAVAHIRLLAGGSLCLGLQARMQASQPREESTCHGLLCGQRPPGCLPLQQAAHQHTSK